MEKRGWEAWKDKARELLVSYRYVMLVGAVGLLLLCWPQRTQSEYAAQPVIGGEEVFSLEELEGRLSAILSKIEGAGNVSVVLTVKRGMERVLAQNMEQSEDRRSSETVRLRKGSGEEEAVLLVQKYPEFQGALVVCEGGDDPQIRLQITQAVSALTGLGTARISVCKGG